MWNAPVQEDLEFAVTADGAEFQISATLFAPDPSVLGADPIVILAVPGGSYDRAYWNLQVPGHAGYSFAEHMVGAGLVVVAIDNLGTGRSQRPANALDVTVELMATAVAGVAVALQRLLATGGPARIAPLERVRLVGVGHSLGSQVVVAAQARQPVFDAIAVLGGSFIGAAGIGADPDLETVRAGVRQMSGDSWDSGYLTLSRALARPLFHAPDVPDAVLAAEAAHATVLPREAAVQGVAGSVLAAYPPLIRVPVLLAFGEIDTSPDPDAEPALYTAAPSVTPVRVAGSGHCHNASGQRAVLWDSLVHWARQSTAAHGFLTKRQEHRMSLATPKRTIPDLTAPDTFQAGIPHESFDEIRQLPGLYWQPAKFATQNGGFWAITRFADIVEIEKNPEVYTSSRGPAFPGTNLPLNNVRVDQLMLMDPPRHSGVRRAAAASFGPRVVANFDPWIREIVIETLDAVAAREEFDWVDDVAAIIPSLVIARVMGVPRSERMFIVDVTRRTMEMQDIQEDNERMQSMVRSEMFSFIETTLEPEVQRHPKDDMASVLDQAVQRGDLTRSESRHFLRLLINAGFETTNTLIAQSMRMMLEDPAVEQGAARGIEELGPNKVIDEFLRMVTPAMAMARTATRDTVLAGEQIREGDLMQLYFIAANRDPDVFSEPHRFNPWRTETATLAFGSGPHRCMGNALAKLEVRILLEEMSRRGLRLQLNGAPVRNRSVFINGLTSLPVRTVPGAGR